MTISNEQLDEWEKLADDAHHGPWFVRYGTNPDYPHGVECGYPQQVISEGDVILIGEFYDGTDVAPAVHAPFVAAARTAVPALIAEVRELRYVIRKIRQEVLDAAKNGDRLHQTKKRPMVTTPVVRSEYIEQRFARAGIWEQLNEGTF